MMKKALKIDANVFIDKIFDWEKEFYFLFDSDFLEEQSSIKC